MSATSPSQTVYSIGYDFHAGNGTANSGTDNGNVFGIINYKDTTHGRDQTFTYDALNRLLTAQNAGTNCATMVLQNKTEYWGNSYGYDAWGNLLQKTITKCGAEHMSVTADAHNWIHTTVPDYQYDAAGNMTYDATASLGYTFDQENRLTGAAGYTYTYDADGNRVRKSNGNLAANGTLYWYMTPGVVAESDLAGTLKSEYVFFDGERVARRDGATGTGGVFYYFPDHLKTASVITDSAGGIKAESDYYPWGGELQFVNNDSNDYKFTGKKRDLETGLDYFGARYYSNGLGRWVSADWAAKPVAVPYAVLGDPQTLNLYAYVGGNPASKADADGHCDSKGFWCKQFKQAASLVVCFMGCQKVSSTSPTAVAAGAVLAKTFQTYTKVKSPGDVYSGRTSGTGTPEENVAARDQGHHKNAEGYGEAKLDKSSTNPDVIRGREQQLIEVNGGAQSKGGTSGNAINGISETNPNGGKYLQAAEHEFGAVNKTGEVPGKLLGAVSIPVAAPPPIVQKAVADFLEAIQK
jgi:RHS repeat-associated protein